MAKLSGKGIGKWQNDASFAKYKMKRNKKRKQASAARKANR